VTRFLAETMNGVLFVVLFLQTLAAMDAAGFFN